MAATNDSTTNPSTLQRSGSGGRPVSFGEQSSKVADDVRELGNIALAGAGDAIQSVKERGNEVIDHAKERGHQLLEKGKEKAGEAREGFEGYVSENPFKAILIAAGIGALIGYSLRRRD
ncbi:MAG: hypothetical protein SGI72_11535 [Planctomycetota bacterium]|nr:hypothetical protein [Planctomycetota bacterium]